MKPRRKVPAKKKAKNRVLVMADPTTIIVEFDIEGNRLFLSPHQARDLARSIYAAAAVVAGATADVPGAGAPQGQLDG